MKNLIVILTFVFVSINVTAQDFSKYETMSGVNSMVMTSKMFKMLNKIEINDSDPDTQAYIDLIENIEQIRVFTSEEKSTRGSMNTDAKSYIASSSMDQLMRVNAEGKLVNFYVKPGRNDDYVNELFMHLNSTDDGEPITVILQITGDLNLKQLSKLASDLKVPGSEELKNLKKQN